jgi:hypothetical protein
MTELAGRLGAVADENLGMAMVYNLVTAAQEWLGDRMARSAGPDPEADRKRAEAAEEARHAAMRAHGTTVTVESFAAWRKRFDAEAAAAKAAAAAAAGGGADGKGGGGGAGGEARLSGKQWFLKQAAAGAELSGEEDEDALAEGEAEEEEDDEGPSATAAGGRAAAGGAGGGDDDEDEDDEDFDPDEDEDDDDDEVLESYLASKARIK